MRTVLRDGAELTGDGALVRLGDLVVDLEGVLHRFGTTVRIGIRVSYCVATY